MVRVNRFFIAVLIASAIFAFSQGGNLPYLFFYCTFAIFIQEYIYMSIQKHFTNAEVIFKETIKQSGDEGECLIIVKCESNLPLHYIEVTGSAYPESRVPYSGDLVSVTSDENAWIRLKIRFNSRGIYDLGSVHLRSYDLFRIMRYDLNLDCDIKVKVYPKIHTLPSISAGGKDIYQEALSQNSSIEDVYTIRNVRKYRPGDSLKRVHWKVSAKQGELFVKESDNISGEEFTLFLDMNKHNYSLDDSGVIEEKMVELCASIVKYLQQRGINARVLLNSLHPQNLSVDTALSFESFMEHMLGQRSDGMNDFPSFIYEHLQSLQRINGIALITGRIDDNLSKAAAEIKGSGYPAAVFYCASDLHTMENASVIRGMGISCIGFMDMVSD